MSRETDVTPVQKFTKIIVGAVTKFVRKQDEFSVVTSVVAGSLAAMFVFDLVFGHPHLNRTRVFGWIVFFGVLTVMPLLFGARYPRLGGLVMLVTLNFWTWTSASSTYHTHTELSVLLQVPILALYVGWFYSAWLARLALFANLSVLVLAIFSRGWQSEHDFSSEKAVVYSFVISLLCLEVASFLRSEADRKSQADPLTGVLNRRGMVDASRKIFKKAARSGAPLTVAVVDFDDFKTVNDLGGHAAGDKALIETASTWVSALGDQDLVARIGGDEFTLIIHKSLLDTERLMHNICESAPYSWSWGLAEFTPDTTLDALMGEADVAMYQAKALRD